MWTLRVSNRIQKSLPLKILLAIFAALAFRYPFWAFQLDAGDVFHIRPWENQWRLLCFADCGIYSILSREYVAASSAFFPGWPALIRGTHALLPSLSSEASAILASNLFSAATGAGLLFFGDYLWRKDRTLGFVFDTRSWLLLLGVSIFPSSHFWQQGFSEPLFAGLIALSCLWAHQLRWQRAALILGLTAILRPQGVWLAAAYMGFYAYHLYETGLWRSLPTQSIRRFLTAGILVSFPFSIFMYWLWKETGDPLYFMTVQKAGWGRSFSILTGLWEHRPRIDISVAYLYLSLFATWRFIRRPEIIWKLIALFTFVLADLPLFVGGYVSYVRFMTANIGLFILLAELTQKRRALTLILALWSLTRLGIQIYHSAQGQWVG